MNRKTRLKMKIGFEGQILAFFDLQCWSEGLLFCHFHTYTFGPIYSISSAKLSCSSETTLLCRHGLVVPIMHGKSVPGALSALEDTSFSSGKGWKPPSDVSKEIVLQKLFSLVWVFFFITGVISSVKLKPLWISSVQNSSKMLEWNPVFFWILQQPDQN